MADVLVDDDFGLSTAKQPTTGTVHLVEWVVCSDKLEYPCLSRGGSLESLRAYEEPGPFSKITCGKCRQLYAGKKIGGVTLAELHLPVKVGVLRHANWFESLYVDSVVVGHRVRGDPVFTVAFPHLNFLYSWREAGFTKLLTGLTTVIDPHVVLRRAVNEIVKRVMVDFETRVTNGKR